MSVLARLDALEQFGIKLGLDNIRTLLDALGRPDLAWPSVHIAGTNGKGSVAAIVEAALGAAGHRTGRYTSPHLDRLEERFALDGRMVGASVLEEAAAPVFDAIDRLRHDGTLPVTPTFFEATTAIAFELFRRAHVDVAVVEVGLGGRFDATNVLAPAATAITSIAMDHERHLGTTLAAVAAEKAGIAKPGVAMVVGPVPDEAGAVIADACLAAGATLVDAAAEVNITARLTGDTWTIEAETPVRRYPATRLALRGRHQVANAAVAIRLLECCEEAGIAVGADAICEALASVEWPGRLEWLSVGPKRVLVDAAHNPAGAAALAAYLTDTGLAPLPLVLGMMEDKDVEGISAILAPVASVIVATTAPTSRGLAAEALGAVVGRVSPATRVDVEPDPDRAVARAWDTADAAVAAGSIYLVGPLRARLVAAGARRE